MAASLDLDHIRLGARPLLVCDIDEVVLEFITPFRDFLRSRGVDLLPRSFRLHGNIVLTADGSPIAHADVSDLIEDFFGCQDLWQKPAEMAVETLHALSEQLDIIFLTAMPPRHEALRRAMLDRFDLRFPLIATEDAKGPVVDRLHDRRALPVIFLDDMVRNHLSVRDHVPDCLLVSLMANADFRALAPPLTETIRDAAGWDEAHAIIRDHCRL